jgi:hypothetical protein
LKYRVGSKELSLEKPILRIRYNWLTVLYEELKTKTEEKTISEKLLLHAISWKLKKSMKIL